MISENYLDILMVQKLLHVSPTNLALYMKDLIAIIFVILVLKLVASSLEKNLKLPAASQ